MGRTVLTDLQSGFGGGLNTSADEARLADDEVRQATNFLLTEYGAAVKRLGSRKLHASALTAAVQNGYGWQRVSGTTDLVVAGGHLYTASYAAPPITYTDRGLVLSTTVIPDFAAFRDAGATECVYIADGGLLNKWDGATFTANIAGTASCTRIVVYNKRLFGITGNDQTIYWSDLNNGDSLGNAGSGGGSAIVRTFSDQRITGLAVIQGELYLYHVSGVSKFTGWTQDDINISAGMGGVTSDVGTLAPRCIVALENEVIFLSDRGFYSASSSGVNPISTQIDGSVSGLSATALAASFGFHFRGRRELWFYLSGVGFYVFQYRLRKWSGPMNGGYLTPVTKCGWESADENGVPIGLVGDADGFVKRAQMPGAFTDNVSAGGTAGTAIEGVLQFHRMFAGGFENTKAFRWGYLLFNPLESEDVTLEWDTQYGDDSYDLPATGAGWGSGTWGSGTWGGSGVATRRIPMSGRGSFIDLTIRDTGTLGGGLYSRFSLECFDMTRRG